MKILTCCAGGTVRSVTMANLLRYECVGKHDVIPISLDKTSGETLSMLFGWANKILVPSEDLLKKIPDQYLEKTILIPIGSDVWGMSMHQELIPIAYSLLDKAGFTMKDSDFAKVSAEYHKRYVNKRNFLG